jgi:hypothetical protein
MNIINFVIQTAPSLHKERWLTTLALFVKEVCCLWTNWFCSSMFWEWSPLYKWRESYSNWHTFVIWCYLCTSAIMSRRVSIIHIMQCPNMVMIMHNTSYLAQVKNTIIMKYVKLIPWVLSWVGELAISRIKLSCKVYLWLKSTNKIEML